MFSPKMTTRCLIGVAVALALGVACVDAAVTAAKPHAARMGRIQRIRRAISLPLVVGRWTPPILRGMLAPVGDAAETARKRSGYRSCGRVSGPPCGGAARAA